MPKTKPKPLRVMEYLDPRTGMPFGWAFLEAREYSKWKKHPQGRKEYVTGYFVIANMELMAEMGMAPCVRLYDYFHTLDAIPEKPFTYESLEARFEVASDHPTNAGRQKEHEGVTAERSPRASVGLDGAQRKCLAAARKLYGFDDWEKVREGLALLVDRGDPALWAVLAKGLVNPATGDIHTGGSAEIEKYVNPTHRVYVEVQTLRAIGALQGRTLLVLMDATVKVLDSLAGLDTLATLTVFDASALVDLGALARLPGLRSLTLKDLPPGVDLGPVGELGGLTHLDLVGSAVTDLRPLARLSKLKVLDLATCCALTDLRPLAALRELASLDLSNCEQLLDLGPLAELGALEELNLRACAARDLSPVASLRSLVSLNLSGHETSLDVGPLAGLPSLATLDLSICESVSDLGPLASLPSLRDLDLSGCTAVTDLRPLGELPSLRKLVLSGCVSVCDLRPLWGLASLCELDLTGIDTVPDLGPLKARKGLSVLHDGT